MQSGMVAHDKTEQSWNGKPMTKIHRICEMTMSAVSECFMARSLTVCDREDGALDPFTIGANFVCCQHERIASRSPYSSGESEYSCFAHSSFVDSGK